MSTLDGKNKDSERNLGFLLTKRPHFPTDEEGCHCRNLESTWSHGKGKNMVSMEKESTRGWRQHQGSIITAQLL